MTNHYWDRVTAPHADRDHSEPPIDREVADAYRTPGPFLGKAPDPLRAYKIAGLLPADVTPDRDACRHEESLSADFLGGAPDVVRGPSVPSYRVRAYADPYVDLAIAQGCHDWPDPDAMWPGAMMAVADREQLWGDVKALTEQVADTRRRAEKAEATIARVEALAFEWDAEADANDPTYDRAARALAINARELFAALRGPEPTGDGAS